MRRIFSILVAFLIGVGLNKHIHAFPKGSCNGLVSIPKDAWFGAIDDKGYLAMLSINFDTKSMRAYTTRVENETSTSAAPSEPRFTTSGPFSTSFTLTQDSVEGLYRLKPSSYFPELLLAPVNGGANHLLLEVNGPGRGTCSSL